MISGDLRKTFSFSFKNPEVTIKTCSEKQVLSDVQSQSLDSIDEVDHFY